MDVSVPADLDQISRNGEHLVHDREDPHRVRHLDKSQPVRSVPP
jgi:hypothetical protein